MIHQPFSLLAPFNDRIHVTFFRKSDAIDTDDDVMQAMDRSSLASAQQVHGNVTIIIRKPVRRFAGADGLVTDARGLTLALRAADCQSFVVYERKSNVLGVLHAGWKGIVSKAIPAFFQTLEAGWNIRAEDCYVGAGPSLCQQCAEFTDPVTELPGIPTKFFSNRLVDLRGIADQQLMDMGVRHGRIERMPDCTKCRSRLYWSYRGGDREKMKGGFANVMVCGLL